jgi:hypothetical protein
MYQYNFRKPGDRKPEKENLIKEVICNQRVQDAIIYLGKFTLSSLLINLCLQVYFRKNYPDVPENNFLDSMAQNIAAPGKRPESNIIGTDKFRETLQSTRSGNILFEKVGNANYLGKEKDYKWTANSFKDMVRSCRSNVKLVTDKPQNISKNEIFTPQPFTEIKNLKKFGDQMQIVSLVCEALNIDEKSPKISISDKIGESDESEALKDAHGNHVGEAGFYKSSENVIEITTSSNTDILIIHLHEYFHSIDTRYSILNRNTAKIILGRELYDEWEKTGFVDNNSSLKGSSLPKEIIEKLERMGLRDYSLRNSSDKLLLEKIKDLSSELSVLEKQKSNLTENSYLSKKALFELELESVKNNLRLPAEIMSTPIEALLINDDAKFNSVEVQAMLTRYFDHIPDLEINYFHLQFWLTGFQ